MARTGLERREWYAEEDVEKTVMQVIEGKSSQKLEAESKKQLK